MCSVDLACARLAESVPLSKRQSSFASDGVWEFIQNQEACNIVAAHMPDTTAAAQALVDEATKRWHAEEEVVDDITALVVSFVPGPNTA